MGERETRIVRRALQLWPRLDRRKVLRTGGDPGRLSRLIARRTALPEAAIEAILTDEPVIERRRR